MLCYTMIYYAMLYYTIIKKCDIALRVEKRREEKEAGTEEGDGDIGIWECEVVRM